jgi:hypothetical protein
MALAGRTPRRGRERLRTAYETFAAMGMDASARLAGGRLGLTEHKRDD